MTARILVAGLGNVFLGDDGFGVAVAERLAARPLPNDVRVIDLGIRGLDLAYELLEGYEAVILIDALPRGGAPGTLYVVEPEIAPHDDASTGLADAHALDPATVLRLVRSLGGAMPRLRIVGCEPSTDDFAMGLSPAVAAAADPAAALVESLIVELREGAIRHA